ncbi:hypothetical protein Pst134EA_032110 [Puccinia striiformis f. sp. tritici]|uniref:uncharacterized protein n=1 Tax=Puccinia striiformis f. sp. tritici TaxID=168172 RepID=UPI0020088D02|nr:uncharacterized protein Pst134EA_032110 [Puccinia striiformis f. sp. tritici]KAH9441883.1 hypothetical protein Pst134EA_032110 [Puccinia striiformis f. sp. tritici]
MMSSTTLSERDIIPPSPTDVFKNLTVFIDPSLPTILALQLKALLSHSQAKITSGSTPNLDQFLASIQVDGMMKLVTYSPSSHEIKSSQNNGNDEEDRISPDPSKARVYRWIHLVTPLWVTQSLRS